MSHPTSKRRDREKGTPQIPSSLRLTTMFTRGKPRAQSAMLVVLETRTRHMGHQAHITPHHKTTTTYLLPTFHMQILRRGHQRVSGMGLQTGTAIGHQRSKNRALWAQQVLGSGVRCLINIHTYLRVSSVGPFLFLFIHISTEPDTSDSSSSKGVNLPHISKCNSFVVTRGSRLTHAMH